MFKSLLATASVIVCLTGPQVIGAEGEALGRACEQGNAQACKQLVKLTGGQCAGPEGSGCQFSLELVSQQDNDWECMTDSECMDWESAPHLQAEMAQEVG